MIKSYLKQIFFIVLLTLLFKPLWVFDLNNLGSFGEDDLSYWLHSSTVAFDFDLNYLDDYLYDEKNFVKDKNTPYHPPGAGFMNAGFVALFDIFENDANIEKKRLNPIGTLGYLGYFIGNLFYLFFGFLLLMKTLKFLDIYYPLIIYLAFLSTLVHFSTTRFLMSHVGEFFISSVLIYLFFTKKIFTNFDIPIIYFAFGLLIFVRPSTFLYSIILLVLFRKKIFTKPNIYINTICSVFVFSIYSLISLKLYNSLTLLFNPGINKTSENFFLNFNISDFAERLLQVPSLFFSTNMGILFSTPIIFIGFFGLHLYLKSFKYKTDKLLFLFYILTPFLISIVWQGYEVSYGQRLFIGLIPIFSILSGVALKKFKINLISLVLFGNTLLGYLMFYTNNLLTLREGINLWGVTSKFTAENYYVYLYTYLFDIETVFTFFTKNIYFVYFLRNVNSSLLVTLSNNIGINEQNLSKIMDLQNKYIEYSAGYTNLYFLSIVIFSFLFVYFFKYPVIKN